MYRDEFSGLWKARNEIMGSLSELVDMKFLGQAGYNKIICKEIKDPVNGLIWKKKESPAEAYANRFLMDIDGHAMTERFRRLLRSKNRFQDDHV